MNVMITQHARLRAEKRLGLTKLAVNRIAQKAFDDGIPHTETRGSFRRYLEDRLVERNGRSIDAVMIYGDHIYLFAGLSLITIYFTPKEFKHVVARIREARRN